MPSPAIQKGIGIVGPGRLGQALGRLLRDLGQPVVAVAGRNLSRTSAAAKFIGQNVQAVACPDLPTLAARILIAVPDDALPSVARELAAAPGHVTEALHTCGSRGPEALAFLAERGTSCGTLHPLQTVSTPEQGVADIPGSYFGITGSGADSDSALAWALEICELLRGHPLTIPGEGRPLYHAAAVMASNYMVAMTDAAIILFKAAGVPADQALPALAPLIRAAVANTLEAGPEQALTGPIERGDEQTVATHLRALLTASGRSVSESVQDLYRSAGLHTVELARRKSPGIDRRIIESLLREEQEP
jgi:predicted short-subunit dehydrogenase-like oxidoreductase (DUF2520 family)